MLYSYCSTPYVVTIFKYRYPKVSSLFYLDIKNKQFGTKSCCDHPHGLNLETKPELSVQIQVNIYISI